MISPTDAFNLACAERGISSAEDFKERLGVPLRSLTIEDALALVSLPGWVLDTWLPRAGQTSIVWVPCAVREYGRLVNIEQCANEDDHDYCMRLQAEYQKGRR